MAQVDFINYFSILFWFFIIFEIYYLINYSFLLPSIYSSLIARKNLYILYYSNTKSKIQNTIKVLNIFFYIKKNIINIFFFLKKYIYVA